MGITGVCAAAGPADAATRIALTSISFEQSAVDESSGGATVTLDWSVADANAAATDVTGALAIQQVSAMGELIGQRWDRCPRVRL
ncbi:hypothetical protein [Actinospica robiniae]|uniref:hypothetical protein n=1 Tax=Actinospica robiniae TaxID=304901 RepID=UPI0003F875E1|nr:hypothetical protein [Actinospica robiniae]